MNASEFVPPSMPRNASQWGAAGTAAPGGGASAIPSHYEHQVTFRASGLLMMSDELMTLQG